MDAASHLLTYLFNEYLPPPLRAFLRDPSSPPQILLNRATPLLSSALSHLTPLFDRLTAALAASPDLVVLAFFLGVLVFMLQVLAYLRRLMMWWTRLAMRAVFWSCVVGVAAMVWRRGWEASLGDAVVVGSKVVGFAEWVKGVFWAELQKYEELEKRRPGQAGMGAATGAGAGGRRGW